MANDKQPRVVIAPPEQMTRIKETLNRDGEAITRQVIEPKKKEK